jgi:hypothetical protein
VAGEVLRREVDVRRVGFLLGIVGAVGCSGLSISLFTRLFVASSSLLSTLV